MAAVHSQFDSTPRPTAPERADLRWIAEDVKGHPQEVLLVASDAHIERCDIDADADVAIAARSQGPINAPALRLAFPDGAFQRIYARGLVPHADEIAALSELQRVLRPDGALVIIAHKSKFTFAPLPAGGEVHALKRTLERAGLTDVRLEHHSAQFVVLTAHRKNQ